MTTTTRSIVAFHRILTEYYYEHGRHDMLWRQPDDQGRFDPYRILVSEIMLQQTQADRVANKYTEFLSAFPDIGSLAEAPLGEVLKLWNGLGYNRRAKYLWQAARMIREKYGGKFPDTAENLRRLPGVGPNTAGAIMAYAYDQPTVYVETNIRTVIIRHYFHDKSGVSDKEIAAVLSALMAEGVLGPREFYWAMMDYGTHLKSTVGNLNRASKSYKRQSKFQGSKRQIRGAVIRLLASSAHSADDLQAKIADERLQGVLSDLVREGLIIDSGGRLELA